MQSEVTVRLNADQEYRVDLSSAEALDHETARRWLDEQFTSLDCEPLRASGKVLLADKVLVVARAAGPALLGDANWLRDFGRAATAALARPVVRVDVPSMAVSY
ncbi:MAG: hypothetical protein ACK40S_07910 [Burkholderiaceae bacterium]